MEEINALKQLGYSAANGMYQNGKIVLSLNNTGGVMSVYFGHELFHDLKQTAPKQANELQTYVLDRLKNNADYDYNARFASLENTYAGSLRGKTESQKKSVIDEEIAANACFTALSNEDNFTALVKKNRSLAEKVRDFFADFVNKIRNALTRLAKNNAEYSALQNDTEAKEKILVMFNKALENSNENLNKSTGIKFSKKIDDYSYDERKVIDGYLDAVDEDMVQFIVDFNNNNKFARHKISLVDRKQANDILSLLKIDTTGYSNNINTNAIRHIENRHGENGSADNSMKNLNDLARIDFILKNYDSVDILKDSKGNAMYSIEFKTKSNEPAPMLLYKKINGTYYLVEAVVENKYKKLWVVSAYINKKGTVTQVSDGVNTPEFYARNELASSVPTNSISNLNKNVNFSFKVDSEGKELSKQQQEYFKDSKVRDEEGRLLVVYHGTDTDFTVFDRTKARANMDIQGSFFSPWEIDAKGYGEKVDAYYLNIINPAPEGVAYKALNKFKGQNYAGVKARDFLERMGYDGVNNGNEEYIAFYPEQIKLVENTAPTDNSDIRYSLKEENDDYSYDTLVSKPDMPVTVINDQKDYTPGKSTRENVVDEAQRSALSVGRKDSSGNVYVYVNDTDTEVMLSKRGLHHSLDRRLSIIAPVTENIGPIIKNSVRINELSPEFETIKNSYVLIGIAKNQKNEPYVVSFVVNRASNEVMSVDVLYAVNAKKEATALIEPELSSQSDVSLTASTISISDLLDYVNRYYPDILPEDVLRHYGYIARPDGVIGESALYSLKEEDNTSIFEDNEELAESAADVQNMLRFVSTENSELRKAFDIHTVRQAEDGSVAKVAAYLRKQYDSSYKIQAAQTSNLLSYYVYLFCSGR